MPIITQATTLMPRHLQTRKLGREGPRAQLTPPSSLLLYRIVVGFRFSGFLIANSHQSKLHTNSNDIWQFINKGKCATPPVASTWLQLWNSSRFFIIFLFFFLLNSFIHSFIWVMGFCFCLLFSTKVDLIQKRISIPMYVSVKAFLRKRCLVSFLFFKEDFFED
jgi:hypothetical protein